MLQHMCVWRMSIRLCKVAADWMTYWHTLLMGWFDYIFLIFMTVLSNVKVIDVPMLRENGELLNIDIDRIPNDQTLFESFIALCSLATLYLKS